MTQFPNIESLSSHLPSPHTPPRTLFDADREIAELRLAMVGMGKTMGNWLDTLEEAQGSPEEARAQAARQGLRRLQRTLIDGATTTTADLKDWAWSQELASTPSVSSTSSASDPLESRDDKQLSAVRPHTPDPEQPMQHPQSADFPTDATSTADTFVLESPPDKDAAGKTPTLRSSGSLRRTEYRVPSSTSQATTGTPRGFGFAGTYGGRPMHTDQQQQQDQPGRSDQSLSIQSIPENIEPSRSMSTGPEVEVDPLSGLAVNHELKNSTFGMKRLSKDPPRGLGFL
jgi:TBC1 domain family protein 5